MGSVMFYLTEGVVLLNHCISFRIYVAIEYAGQLAGAQLKVEALRRRYRELLAKKELLKKQQESS